MLCSVVSLSFAVNFTLYFLSEGKCFAFVDRTSMSDWRLHECKTNKHGGKNMKENRRTLTSQEKTRNLHIGLIPFNHKDVTSSKTNTWSALSWTELNNHFSLLVLWTLGGIGSVSFSNRCVHVTECPSWKVFVLKNFKCWECGFATVGMWSRTSSRCVLLL